MGAGILRIETGDNSFGISGAAAGAADEHDRFGALGMIERGQERDTGTDADAGENRFPDTLVVADAEHVVHHVAQIERRFRFVGEPIATQVNGDDAEERREAGDLIEPQAPIEGIGMNEHERRALAMNLVMDFQAVSGRIGHDMRPRFRCEADLKQVSRSRREKQKSRRGNRRLLQ